MDGIDGWDGTDRMGLNGWMVGSDGWMGSVDGWMYE